jgi:hypothetical protein
MTTDATVTGHRRSDVGEVRLTQRDIDGLILCAEQAGVPYDLLAAALAVEPARLRAIVARWRRAGYAVTGPLGPGPAWCWLTPAGMTACGLGYPAGPPRLARLDHLRAVLAARLWFQSSPAGYAQVIYLTAPAARGVVARCADALPAGSPAVVKVWDLPPDARIPGT